ncbi:MAG: carbamoyl-phosphate synthase large subunit [Candidatus Deianiraeaceae bacterium]|jgi:carbamoyl-phosphate synthase large subunit
MPKVTDIKSILIIGAGPIVIGQACEFDYSGSQACKALKKEGYYIILVNSNPATIMTDTELADRTYIEPITPETIEKIIKLERPDAILPTVGGQTALNCALELEELGILEKYNVRMLGANSKAITKAEDRAQFNVAMKNIGLDVPKNAVVSSVDEALNAVQITGLPAIIRPSFTLGGAGGGIAETKEQFISMVENGLNMSPTNAVQIDESIIGWKEYEMEVIRDSKDNAIIVCAIENVDPMGTHTGDSITVAPALTLTDKEYQIMRNASIAVLREIGVETGGSNVQFAVNPKNGKMVVIEMNPRVSRSSALASKATGFPIAKVAALLAVGYTLDEIQNDITQITPASFEPTIDYVVTKIPRFTFEKFDAQDNTLSSTMRSVGEVMAIGRSFAESIQKGLCSIETGLTGFDEIAIDGVSPNNSREENFKIIKKDLQTLHSDRLLRIAQALRYGVTADDVCISTQYDPWFIQQIQSIVIIEQNIKKNGIQQSKDALLKLKKMGFSDKKLAELTSVTEEEIFAMRKEFDVMPVYKRVDTCASEFQSITNYMYSCYEGNSITPGRCEAMVSNKNKVIILGSGPNRIGQGIEFDYSCVQAAVAVTGSGCESIMINCNPETVSTDYDTSDRLYFEPMTNEHVLSIVNNEQKKGNLLGVIVQFGGQTALKLAKKLDAEGIKILGTSYDNIDLAEDRERFQKLLQKINLKQPNNITCYNLSDIHTAAERVGYPVVIRPSNVLGGRAMAIVHHGKELDRYIKRNSQIIIDGPILVDKFLNNAIEVDVDALCDGKDVDVVGIMEHIEEAGIHSGDSACSLPPYSLTQEQIDVIKESTVKLAKAINVIGLINIQFAIKNGELFVIEVNPRASRTVPFVAKATGINVVKIATLISMGQSLGNFNTKSTVAKKYFSVKEVVFPFARFDYNMLLTPEMKSTGEAMGTDVDVNIAFYKAQIATNYKLNNITSVLISVQNSDKNQTIVDITAQLLGAGVKIYATKGTAEFLQTHNICVECVKKVGDGNGSNDVGHLIKKRLIHMVINTDIFDGVTQESHPFRKMILMNRIFYMTTLRAAECMTHAIVKLRKMPNGFTVTPLQDIYSKSI